MAQSNIQPIKTMLTFQLLSNRISGLTECSVKEEDVLLEDACSPSESIGYNHIYAIGNEFGCLCVLWAQHDQDAMDAAIDADKLDSHLIENPTEEQYEQGLQGGNASETFNQDYLWIQEVNSNKIPSNLWYEIATRKAEGEDTL